MKQHQRITLLLAFILSPLFFFSQENFFPKNNDSKEEINKNFIFEKLPEEWNSGVKFENEYHKGRAYYNEGVDIMESLDYEKENNALDSIVASVSDKFKLALPHFKKACELNPTNKSTLYGLAGIYFSLNDFEKSEKYKDELNLLKKEE